LAPLAETEPEWAQIDRRLRVFRLNGPILALIPALALSGAPKSTRGISYHPGRLGIGLGSLIVLASLAIGALLYPSIGVVGPLLSLWLLGSTGVAMVLGGFFPFAFVKQICKECRLLPVVKEHEAIHLSGVASEASVWSSMRSRYSVESLHLAGDPAICSFCPIPKRLAEK